MKALRIYLAVTLIAGTISVVSLSQKAYAADHENSAVRKIEIGIDTDRDKIIEESKAIKADRRKLKEAEKIADKAKVEQIKQEINQDIEKRKAAIKDLKTDISNKKDQKNDLVYGKGQKIPKRSRKQ